MGVELGRTGWVRYLADVIWGALLFRLLDGHVYCLFKVHYSVVG
jgi:hypothetical protein